MPREKVKPSLTCDFKSYDLDGWEGGIAVFAMDGEYGVKIIAIPKLGVSTCLTGTNNNNSIRSMLNENRTMRYDPKAIDLLAKMILCDFAV